jgi:thiol-disulfide isomerase/thioredoxin
MSFCHYIAFMVLLTCLSSKVVGRSVVELNDTTFDIATSSGLWVINFHAPWCDRCKALEPIFEEVAVQTLEDVHFGSVNVGKNKVVKRKYEVTKLPFFRKRVVSTMPQLGYLDRHIDEQERRLAEAFVRGGADEEAAERSRWRDEQTARRQREQAEFREWQAKHQKEEPTTQCVWKPVPKMATACQENCQKP